MTADPSKRYLLKLYTAGRSADAALKAKQLEEAIHAHCPGLCEVERIDVLADPERALRDNIFATPTLVKELPEPLRRVIGDISDTETILLVLGIMVEK